MKKSLYIVLLLLGLLLSVPVSAEIIRLKSGKQLEGTIVFQNEEVVVIRDASGKRFQYPMSDVAGIGEAPSNQEKSDAAGQRTDKKGVSPSDEAVQVAEAPNAPKVSICLGVNGGASLLPLPPVDGQSANQLGAGLGADFSVGTYSLLKRKIFLGGGLGFHGYLMNGKNHFFLPVTLRVEVPLMQTKHAPVLGMGAGYGIGLQGMKGGFYGALQFGWKVSYGRKGGFFLGLFGDFQQARLTETETISGVDYTSEAQRSLCSFGAKTALYF